MISLIALNSTKLGPISGIGPLSVFSNKDEAFALFSKVMSIVIGFLTVVAGLYFVFQFIIGAIGWIGAGGDKAKVQAAGAKITQAVIGLAVVIAAVFLIDLIGRLLGIKVLSPGSYLKNIWG